jgi:hypothetical protein
VPDSFATSDDATGYAYPLPDATADGLLARATQALIDAAGFGILTSSATVKLRADNSVISLKDVPLVTDVSALALVHDDSTTEPVTAWHWPGTVAGMATDIWLEHSVPGRHCGIFAVTLTQGLASVPVSLKMLTSAVAYRFAAMPAAMAAGITSRSVGGVSWSASSPPPTGDLTAGELAKLRKIVPVRHVYVVPA